MLAHKGSHEGLVAAAVISGKNEEYDARCVPAVIFTSPEMSSVGLTEEQCKEKGLNYKTGQFPFAASGRAMTLMETDGFREDHQRQRDRRGARRSHGWAPRSPS